VRITVAITGATPHWAEALSDAEGVARRAAVAAVTAAACGFPTATEIEVSVLLADDAAVRRLNRDYRGQDRPTNVLSFSALDETISVAGPGSVFPGPVLLGDVVLAFETVRHEAAAHNKGLAHHVSHLVVHGVLHLLGYDHAAEDEAAAMEALETRVLAGLGVPDPYAEASRSGAEAGV
jgi:probable rRNA maturation factor